MQGLFLFGRRSQNVADFIHKVPTRRTVGHSNTPSLFSPATSWFYPPPNCTSSIKLAHSAHKAFLSVMRHKNLKKIIIIAGPNGAGKTTFARDFLPGEAQTLRFINADLIAAGLAPFDPESASFKAGRLMLEEIDECVDTGKSFAFETTLSGLVYLRKIELWQRLGYQVKLWFLSLPNEDIAVSRVARRVAQGGHNIPEAVIRRRFKAGLENFHDRYSKVVDSWALYDNYGIEPKLIDWSNQ